MRKAEIQARMWASFMQWMDGQTVSEYDDGEINYYDHDVERFLRQVAWAANTLPVTD